MGSVYSYRYVDPWKKCFSKEGSTFAEYRWQQRDQKFQLSIETDEEGFVKVRHAKEMVVRAAPELIESIQFSKEERYPVSDDFVKVTNIIETKLDEAAQIVIENQVRTRSWWCWCCYDTIIDYEAAAVVMNQELVPSLNSKIQALGYTVNAVGWTEHRLTDGANYRPRSFLILLIQKNGDVEEANDLADIIACILKKPDL